LRFMLVGAGFGASHLAWLVECKGVIVETLCYRSAEKRAYELAERFGISHVTTDPLEVIKRRNVDIVAVVSPPVTHEPILTAALSAGLPVVSDKPLAHDSQATGRLAELVRGERRHRASVTFQWRQNPALARLRELTLAGRFGSTVRLNLEFHHDFLAGPVTAWSWRHRGAGAGALSDQGVHLLDLLRWFAPKDWAVAAAVGSVVWPRRTVTGGSGPADGYVDCAAEDTAEILLRAGDDTTHARVAVSRVSAGYRALRVVVEGTDGLGEVCADPDDGSAVLRAFSGDGEAPPVEFGPHSMNPYPAILQAVESGANRAGSAADGVADFADGHAAQVLAEEALRAGVGRPVRRRVDPTRGH
jgi:predicted dehydrogenase